MFTVIHERPQDGPHIDSLLDLAFGPDRQSKTSHRYRQGIGPLDYLSLVALQEGQLVGTIRYWPVVVGGEDAFDDVAPVVLLGPLAIHPDLRGLGIGMTLMDRSLRLAMAAGHRLAVLVGDLAYYARAGFSPAAPHGLVMPAENPDRLLLRELKPGSLAEICGVLSPWRAAAHPQPAGIAALQAALGV